jgi:DNA-binding transcriptional LysR family regulator
MGVALAILMHVDPHQLRTFVTVARRGSFSKAAEELGYTQSAVSQHIAALESDLGAVLLSRRPVTPTSAGARLLEHAGPLLLRLEAARADIARLTAAPTSRLVAALSPLAITPHVADALSSFDLTLRVLDRDAIPAAVATGAVDFGLTDGIAAPNDPLYLPDVGLLTTVAVVEQPLVVVLPDDHPLAGRAGLRLPDLADARWIDAPGTGIPLSRLRSVGGTGGFRASVRYEGTDVRGVIALAAAGHGLTLLPRGVAHGVPISSPPLVHRVELLHSGLPQGLVESLTQGLGSDRIQGRTLPNRTSSP